VTKIRCLIPLAATAALLVAAATASAASYNYYNGFTASYSGEYGARHSLTKNEVTVTGGYDGACINALNDDGSGWAGSTYCTYSYTYHPYCGCKLRKPWVADSGQFLNTNHVNYGVYVVAIGFY
jgi:hypothetical protein